MRHPKLIEWEKRLKQVFDEIDHYLEEKFGDRYTLHPARAKRGTTSNSAQDGLFRIGASFTAGYGSEFGRGYVIDVDMVTLEQVPDDVKTEIEKEVMSMLDEKLPNYFPGKILHIDKDGPVIKIHGDLRLGTL